MLHFSGSFSNSSPVLMMVCTTAVIAIGKLSFCIVFVRLLPIEVSLLLLLLLFFSSYFLIFLVWVCFSLYCFPVLYTGNLSLHQFGLQVSNCSFFSLCEILIMSSSHISLLFFHFLLRYSMCPARRCLTILNSLSFVSLLFMLSYPLLPDRSVFHPESEIWDELFAGV